MAVPVEVTVVRLYYKSAGTQSLRKSAAAELARLMADGWHEKHRKAAADHVVLRLERPRPTPPSMPAPSGGGGHGRPRR